MAVNDSTRKDPADRMCGREWGSWRNVQVFALRHRGNSKPGLWLRALWSLASGCACLLVTLPSLAINAVQLDSDRSIAGLTFTNAGLTQLSSDSGTTRTVTLGSTGITVNNLAGAVTIGLGIGIAGWIARRRRK